MIASSPARSAGWLPWRLRARCIVCGQEPRIAENILLSHDDATRLRFDVAVCCGSLYCRDRILRGDIKPW